MPAYALIRMERHPSTMPGPGGDIPAYVLKVVPLALVAGRPLTIDAESPEIALSMAIRRYPHFRHLLATQEVSAYEQQHPHDASRILRGPKARSPRAEG